MVEKVENPSETDDQHIEEASKYWDEAVRVRVGGEEAPPEEKKDEEEVEKEEIKAEEDADTTQDETEPQESGDDAEETEAEEVDEEEVDPWEGVPVSLKERFEEEKALREKYEHSAKSNAGRIGALQKEINALSRKLEESQAPTAKDEKKEPPVDPGDSLFADDKWKKFKDEFGEVADPIEATIRSLYKSVHSRLSDTDKVSQEIRQKHDQQYMVEQAAKLEAERPGWRQYIDDNRPDFDDYVASDPVAQELLKPNVENLTDAGKARALVDLFRLHMDQKNPAASSEAKTEPKPRPLTPKRKAQLKSAGTPPPRSHPAPGRRSDDLPDPDSYEDAERFFLEQPAR